jgi:hypothetical protein
LHADAELLVERSKQWVDLACWQSAEHVEDRLDEWAWQLDGVCVLAVAAHLVANTWPAGSGSASLGALALLTQPRLQNTFAWVGCP